MSRPGPAAPIGLRVRTPRTTLVPVLVLAVCVLPLASAAPWLAVLWLLPLVTLAWVLRVGVDVNADGLTVRALLGSRRLSWADVAGLRVGARGRLAAVLRTGGSIRLPVLRARHLPLVAAASGGHLPDPERGDAPSPADRTAAPRPDRPTAPGSGAATPG